MIRFATATPLASRARVSPRLALFAGLLAAAGAHAAPRALHERLLARIPVGPDPAAISDAECVGRRPYCAAGLAILSPSDSLYFYDLGNDNVKVIAFRPHGGLARIAPGLGPARATHEIPIAGDAGADGTLRVLVGVPGSAAPPALWVLEPGSAEWRRAPAEESRVTAAAFEMPGMPAIPGVPKQAIPVGRDAAGNWFVVTSRSWSTQVLAKYGRDGRLLAEATLPERPIWKPLVGTADKWVTSRGEVVEVYVGSRWLVVARWAEGS